METVCIDESGYTGADLMNADQPIQAASAVRISEIAAKALIDHHFPKSRALELKYRELVRREKHWPALLSLQKAILDHYHGISYVCDKKFAATLKLLDYCLEPVAYAGGVDFYANGHFHALASVIHLCAPIFWGADKFNNLLQSFQEAVRQKTDAKVDSFFNAYNEIGDDEFNRELFPLAMRHPICEDSIRDPETTMDIGVPLVIGLLSKTEQQKTGDYTILHDRTKNMREIARHLDLLVATDESKSFRLSNFAALTFPLRLKHVRSGDSRDFYGLQLADILVGGAVDIAYCKIGLKPETYYTSRLESLYTFENFLHLFPSIDFSETRERFANNQSSEFINFLSGKS